MKTMADISPSPDPSSDTVVVADDTMTAAWDAFVASHEAGSFYHLFAWKHVNEEALGHECHYLAAQTPGGAVRGVLPLVFVRSRVFGRILCSMPFVNFGGPIAATPRVATLLVNRATALARELDADYLELRCAAPLDTDLPVSLRKVSLSVQLTADPEALYESFSRKHRKNIRSAQKRSFEVRVGGADLLGDFFAVLEESWRNLGTPLYSIDYFERILATFPKSVDIFICRHRDRPIGAAFTAHFNGTVEGMWAGGRPEMRHLDGNYVLYWEMLRHACTAGHKRFHLGRSTSDSGAEQFKVKWNAAAEQLYWYFARPSGGPIPELNTDNPKYRLAIATWQRLPLAVTRVVGPRLARLIP
jgi:FemAB-related protein (PEP-CTERM system-associated)